jgi:hypothetical protein
MCLLKIQVNQIDLGLNNLEYVNEYAVDVNLLSKNKCSKNVFKFFQKLVFV